MGTHPLRRTARHAQPVAPQQRLGEGHVPGPGAHQRLAHRQLGADVAPRRGQPVSQAIGPRPARLHQRPRVALIRLHPARARGVHRRIVGICHDHLVPQPLQVLRHPLALGARLQQDAGPWPVPQHRREPLPARDDPPLRDGPILVADAELALAFVQIEPYRIHLAAGLPVCAPSQDGERVHSCGAEARHHVTVEVQLPLHTN